MYAQIEPAVDLHDCENTALDSMCRFSESSAARSKCYDACLGWVQVLDKFVGIDFTVEYKYDGERAQVHVMEDGRVAIYRRARMGRAANAAGMSASPHWHGRITVSSTSAPMCVVWSLA